MSHPEPGRRRGRPVLILLLIAGAVFAYRKATADRGGVFDPDRPETH